MSSSQAASIERAFRQRKSKRRLRQSHGESHPSYSSTGFSYPNIQPAPRPSTAESNLSDPSQQIVPAQATHDLAAWVHDEVSTSPAQFSTSTGPSAAGLSFHSSRPNSKETPGTANALSASSGPSYIGDSGFLSLFEQEHRTVAANTDTSQNLNSTLETNLPPLELQQSFAETYVDCCWPWCPVVDKEHLYSLLGTTKSPIFINALALLGTQMRPPIVQHSRAQDYYTRAKMLFYTDQEKDPIVCLQSIILFYWWVPKAPSIVHKDSAWWWTGLAIKYAQVGWLSPSSNSCWQDWREEFNSAPVLRCSVDLLPRQAQVLTEH